MIWFSKPFYVTLVDQKIVCLTNIKKIFVLHVVKQNKIVWGNKQLKLSLCDVWVEHESKHAIFRLN